MVSTSFCYVRNWPDIMPPKFEGFSLLSSRSSYWNFFYPVIENKKLFLLLRKGRSTCMSFKSKRRRHVTRREYTITIRRRTGVHNHLLRTYRGKCATLHRPHIGPTAELKRAVRFRHSAAAARLLAAAVHRLLRLFDHSTIPEPQRLPGDLKNYVYLCVQ